jgi:hypothetical protein
LQPENSEEAGMKTRLFQLAMLAVCAAASVQVSIQSVDGATALMQANPGKNQGFAGKWDGTYASADGGSGKVSITFTKGENGKWSGSIKYTNQEGEQAADFKMIQIEGTKFKAGFESPDKSVDITLEGEFQESRFEGTYNVLSKDSKESVEKGTWKTAKSSGGAAK